MRICYFGLAASIHVRRWTEWFARHGHEVFLITPPSKERVEGVRVVPAPMDRAFYLPRPRLLSRIRRTVRAIRPDIVHGHYVLGYGMYAALSGVSPLIVSAWGGDIARAPADSRVARRIARFVLRRADLIHVGDRDSIATIVELGGAPSKCFVQPWGVDTSEFSPKHRDPVLRTSLSPHRELLFVSNRSLEPSYNHEVLLRAARELAARRPGFRIAIAGTGSAEVRLHDLTVAWGLGETVTFLGRVSPDRMPTLYASGDVYVDGFSSQVPGHGASLSLVEAMACGLPPIVAERPGLDELVEDGVSGFRFEGSDAIRLAGLMERFLETPALASRLGEEARRRACDRADMDRNLSEFEREMDRLLARGAGAGADP